MRPKEFYDKYPTQKDERYVFVLLPSELEDRYRDHIKEPLEEIHTETGSLICESYLEIPAGEDISDAVWKGIQRASIVIADLTKFKPNVMFELGVALMKKDSVILIAEESGSRSKKLPFDVGHLKVHFYKADALDDLSEFLRGRIGEIVERTGAAKPKIKNRAVQTLMNDAIELRKNKKEETALALFPNMDSLEPENWYIFTEWGKTYTIVKDYEQAQQKFTRALELAKTNRQKAEVHIEQAKAHLSENQIERALNSYAKAENLDSDNAELYNNWAYLHSKQGAYDQAMTKMMMAVKLDPTNNNKDLLEYYNKKFMGDFKMSLSAFLRQKREERSRALRPQPREEFSSRPRPSLEERKSSRAEPNRDTFMAFTRKHHVRSVLDGVINGVRHDLGVFVDLEDGMSGLIFRNKLPMGFETMRDTYAPGLTITVRIKFYDFDRLRIQLDQV